MCVSESIQPHLQLFVSSHIYTKKYCFKPSIISFETWKRKNINSHVPENSQSTFMLRKIQSVVSYCCWLMMMLLLLLLLLLSLKLLLFLFILHANVVVNLVNNIFFINNNCHNFFYLLPWQMFARVECFYWKKKKKKITYFLFFNFSKLFDKLLHLL